jgi:hypothetical protein
MKFFLANQDTCHIISIPALSQINRIGVKLSCGDFLAVGDRFLNIGRLRSGANSAGFSTITMADGWHQKMEGIYTATDHDFVLMSAYHSQTGKNALDGYQGPFQHSFIAYTIFHGSDLHYANIGGASRLILTNSIIRCPALGPEFSPSNSAYFNPT